MFNDNFSDFDMIFSPKKLQETEVYGKLESSYDR